MKLWAERKRQQNTNVTICADETAISAQSWQEHITHSMHYKTLEPWLNSLKSESKCVQMPGTVAKQRTIKLNIPLLLFNENIY